MNSACHSIRFQWLRSGQIAVLEAGVRSRFNCSPLRPDRVKEPSTEKDTNWMLVSNDQTGVLFVKGQRLSRGDAARNYEFKTFIVSNLVSSLHRDIVESFFLPLNSADFDLCAPVSTCPVRCVMLSHPTGKKNDVFWFNQAQFWGWFGFWALEETEYIIVTMSKGFLSLFFEVGKVVSPE